MLVGGTVRDHLMGRPIRDWDIEVHGIAERQLEKILRKLGPVNAVGRSFAVYKLGAPGAELDVSLPRRDSNAGPGHRGIRVQGDPHMGPREAARRRDLTINAILLDLDTGALLDPWGGLADLAARRLRAVDSHTFLEDPLRALRVVQFAARLAFDPTDDLLALCREASLHELPPERIQEEWRKLLLGSPRPSVGLRVARDADILARVFPEANAVDAPAVDIAVDRMAERAFDPEGRRYAALLSAWLHRGDSACVDATLDRLWLHSWHGYPVRDRVRDVIAAWTDPCDTDADLRHLAVRAEPDLVLTLRWAVSGDPHALARRDRALALGVLHEPPGRLLLGRHLGVLDVPPGPAMGRLLAHVYTRQLDGAVRTTEEALDAARAWWAAQSKG